MPFGAGGGPPGVASGGPHGTIPGLSGSKPYFRTDKKTPDGKGVGLYRKLAESDKQQRIEEKEAAKAQGTRFLKS